MPGENQEFQTRPFHETIVEALDSTSYQEEVHRLAVQIYRTTIPENHDAIVSALRRAFQRLPMTSLDLSLMMRSGLEKLKWEKAKYAQKTAEAVEEGGGDA